MMENLLFSILLFLDFVCSTGTLNWGGWTTEKENFINYKVLFIVMDSRFVMDIWFEIIFFIFFASGKGKRFSLRVVSFLAFRISRFFLLSLSEFIFKLNYKIITSKKAEKIA